MNLSKIRAEKAENTKYMVDEIAKVIDTCGKREPGSKGETEAINYMASELGKYCDEVKVEPFDVHTAAFFGWIYISVTLMLLAVAFYFFLPIVSLVLVIIGIIVMVGQFILYRQFIDKLFKKTVSHNVTAVVHPKGEVKRRIFFNGHPDAAYEWTFNYHFGGIGYGCHVVASFIGVFFLLAIAIAAVIINGIGVQVNSGALRILGYIALAIVPFWVGMYFMSNEKIIVDGANDNLTGCYMGIAIVKALKEQGIQLENTEVGVLLTGSEEAGLRGAKAWCRTHKDDYKDCETLILAFDTIHESKFLCVNERDLNFIVKADARTSKLFKDACDEEKVHCDLGSVPFGATDSAAFNQAGFKAVGITAMDHNLQDYYHTRKDTAVNLSAEAISDCFVASVKALENFDNGK